MYQFEKLDVWKESLVIIEEVYTLVSKFPNEERFALTDQIKRAVVSISLNIAEGRGSSNDKEFVRFLNISLASLFEVVAGLKIAIRLGYIIEEETELVLENINVEAAKIKKLINTLKIDRG